MINDKATSQKVWVALLLVYFIWGSTYLGIRLALGSMPPFLLAGTRFLAAGLSLYGFARWRGAPPLTRRQWRDAGIVGVALLLGGNGGVTYAEQYIPSGLTALLVATVPLFMTFFAWLSGMGPRPTWMTLFALGLGLCGTALLSFQSAAGKGNPVHWSIGIGAVLLASIVWAGGSLYSRQAARPESAVIYSGAQMLLGGLSLLLAACCNREFGNLRPITLESGLAWIYLVTIGAIVGFSAYLYLLQSAEPALIGTYAFVNPVVAVSLGCLVLGEPITPATVAGAACTVVAVALIVLPPARKRPAPSPVPRPEPVRGR